MNSLYELWCNCSNDEAVSQALQEMLTDVKRRDYAFCDNLAFGTGGIRGIMDAGTNCMNVYTVAATSQGVADYFATEGACFVISYDSRHNSQNFAFLAATVLANNGIKVYLADELQPTPFLSYAVRYYNAVGGIMITASHNPREYNGYKVYGGDGVQINESAAKAISSLVRAVNPFEVNTVGFQQLLDDNKICYIPRKVLNKYVDTVLKQAYGDAAGMQIVYSALNGCGYKLVPQVLRHQGAQVHCVKTQCYPSGDFTTCAKPNPERADALQHGELALRRTGYDLLLATDPDCDRVGVVVNHKGELQRLSGNEVGVLLADYLLAMHKAAKKEGKPIVVKTIVTTDMIAALVDSYGGETVDLLTGFKYIGEYLQQLIANGEQQRFVLGFEESCGYLSGSYCGDKDGVLACMLIAEMAAYNKKRGRTLVDRLNTLYRRYGKYHSYQFTLAFEGAEGGAKRLESMHKLRSTIIKGIAGIKVLSTADLSKGGTLPPADVLIYTLEHNNKLIIRPSGTEPLIKFYAFTTGCDKQAKELFSTIEQCFRQFLGNS